MKSSDDDPLFKSKMLTTDDPHSRLTVVNIASNSNRTLASGDISYETDRIDNQDY
jgi:hypothetical protein